MIDVRRGEFRERRLAILGLIAVESFAYDFFAPGLIALIEQPVFHSSPDPADPPRTLASRSTCCCRGLVPQVNQLGSRKSSHRKLKVRLSSFGELKPSWGLIACQLAESAASCPATPLPTMGV